MYRNFQNNQLFTKEVDVIFADKATFKTITDKKNIRLLAILTKIKIITN